MKIDNKFRILKDKIASRKKLLVMFSGGLDSALLAFVAKEVLGNNAAAITVDSTIISAADRQKAVERAAAIGIDQTIIPVHELADHSFKENNPRRCYHCRKIRNRAVLKWASEQGYPAVAEGMNVSDLSDYRPGLEASNEDGIWKPFIECNISKEEIKTYSKHMDLSWWDSPATVCLCSRVPYGTPIDEKELRRIEKAEAFITGLGFSPVRVRSLPGGIALIEVTEPAKIVPYSGDITVFFKDLGFAIVSLDMEGFASGKLNRTMNNAVE